MSIARPHVVVLGSSFAGLTTARFIRARCGDAVDLTVIDRNPYLIFVPNIPMEVLADHDPLVSMHMETVRFHDRDGNEFINAAITAIDSEAKVGDRYRLEIICFGDMGGHKGFYIHSDTWYGGKSSVFKMGYTSWAMKMAFKEMYFRTGGKPISWGMPATEFTMDRLPVP